MAAAGLEDPRAIPALLDTLRGGSIYETHEAADALYALSARTLGYGYYEPSADQEAAARLREQLPGSRGERRTDA